MANFKLALDAGHYMGTPGKRCLKSIDPKETREWYLNDRICDKLTTALKDYEGIEIKRVDNTTGKTDVTLSNRCKTANDWGADLYLSTHHNAGVKGGKGGGLEVYRYTRTSPNSETARCQKLFYDELIKAGVMKGDRSKPTPTADFTVLINTKMIAILVECGFMDSQVDTPIILTEEFADKVVKGYVNALVKWANLKKKEPVKPKEPDNLKAVEAKPSKKPVVTVKYFKKYNGNAVLVQALKELGINSAFNYRAKIAVKNGIAKNIISYLGTKKQNEKMLSLLKKGKLIKP